MSPHCLQGFVAVVTVATLAVPAGLAAQASPRRDSAAAPRRVADLECLEQAWTSALLRHDTAFVARILVPELVGADEHGRVEGRAEAIHNIATGTSVLTAYTYEIDSARTHLYGDVTVVVGRQHYAGTFRGKHSEGDSRLIDVFVWRQGRWQAVGSQESPIAR